MNIINHTNPTENGRGCGERAAGDAYMCCGTSPYGLSIDYFITDPAREWVHKWQRGFQLVQNSEGIYHVVIFVGKTHYPSVWSFVEEARRYGVSRRLPDTFYTGATAPITKLTPGESMMLFVHSKCIPTFEYTVPLSDKRCTKGYVEGRHQYGLTKIPCTFALESLSCLNHDANDVTTTDKKFKIHMPSFSFEGHVPTCQNYTDKWLIGQFLALPITHFEAKDYIKPELADMIALNGFSRVVLSY